MNSGFDRLQDLESQIQSMSRTESPAELFKVLRDACRLASPRGSVFLVRQGKIQGWSAFGYEPEATEAQRKFSCALGDGWLGRIATDLEVVTAVRPEDAADPDFGQTRAAEALGAVVRIQGKPIALVVAEREAGQTPWHPEINGALVTMARLRLELDLALRKLENSRPTAGPKATTETPPAQKAQPSRTPAVTAAEPAAEGQDQKQAALEAAKRYARLVATDIRLYNEEAVVLGRRNGDLDRRLEQYLDRGRETFLRRHADLGDSGLDLLHEAYVQVLAAGDDKLIPPSVVH